MAQLSLENSSSYRVFISSKSEDYPLAEKVYEFLLSHNISAFLACTVLQQIGEAEYARAIDAALDSSEHIIVVASKLEYLTSKWVQYEWSTFSDDKNSGYRQGNILTILSPDIEHRLLPRPLRHKQSFTFSNYKDSILGYLNERKPKYETSTQDSTSFVTEEITQDEFELPDIEIVDNNNPIIPLLGLPNVGKTMTLIRLTRYLEEQGYRVEPDRFFRASKDDYYSKLCDTYQCMVNSAQAASSTSLVSILMVNVYDKRGRKICSFIDTPGEMLTENSMANNKYLKYIQGTTNRKIWLFLLEPKMMDNTRLSPYRKCINEIIKNSNERDRNILLLNKSDLLNNYINPNNQQQLYHFIENRYPEILSLFDDHSFKNLLLRKLQIYTSPYIISFHTGSFHESESLGLIYQPSSNTNPKRLWDLLLKMI